ncbi:cytochrome P450 [Ramaria rubella]|nr:cytochrome P450 [Ramaria rubella]
MFWSLIGAALLSRFIVQRISVLWQLYKHPSDIHHRICLIEPITVLGATLPTTFWNPGLNCIWNWKDSLYRNVKSEAILFVPILWGKPSIHSSSPEILQEVMNYQYANPTFDKPMSAKLPIMVFGPNVIASGGHQWRRHRKITSPAFDQATYELVWDEVIRLYNELSLVEGWSGNNRVDVKAFNLITTKLALYVISRCGFNEPTSWIKQSSDDEKSLQDIVKEVSELTIPRSVLPAAAYYLPIKGIQNIKYIYNKFGQVMKERIATRREEIQKHIALSDSSIEMSKDVFSRLIMASEKEGAHHLSDEEVLGNSFGFLFAGHETTASSMVFVAAYLALYPEEQQLAYEAVKAVTEGGREPTIKDYGALFPVLACFYEIVRLYPAGYINIREATADTALSIPNLRPGGKASSIFIPKGNKLTIDLIGTGRNPRIYPSPHEFMPSRWKDNGGADTLFAFSLGPRACLGRKFASTEAVCFLSLLLRDWRIEVVMDAGETREQWMNRFLTPMLKGTLVSGDVPLTLVRRRID